MNSGSAQVASDRLLAGYDRLAAIVGAGRAIQPSDSDRFNRYLKDETYLTGNASLVLVPNDRAQLLEIVRETIALRAALPAEADALALTLRGGGSGLSGACVPATGIVLDLTRLDRILEIDEKNQFVRTECGVVLAGLAGALGGSHLQYAVDVSSSGLCTVGGTIATNAAGPSSLKYGSTRHNLAGLRFLTAEAEIISAGSLPQKTSMGFSLPDLFCGSEGRLGVVVEADLRLVARPEEMALVVSAFATESAAADFIFKLRQSGLKPRCIEILDAMSARLVDFPPGCPQGGALLMIEFDGQRDEVSLALTRLETLSGAVDWLAARDATGRNNLWNRRKVISIELKKLYPFRLGEDVAVPLPALPQAMAFARRTAAELDVATAIWGHAGDGNLHVNYLLEDATRLPVVARLMQLLAAEVTRLGGAMSGEHGLGRLKKKIARQVLPPAYFEMQGRIKQAFDAGHLFNPALEKE